MIRAITILLLASLCGVAPAQNSTLTGSVKVQGDVQLGAGAAITPPFVATYYVSPATGPTASPCANGNDISNNGMSTAHPFATIGKAKAAIEALTRPLTIAPIVAICQGTNYGLNLVFNSTTDNGDATHQVTWQAYPGHSVTLSGGQQLTGWATSTSGACATATSTCYQTLIPNTTPYPERLYYNHVFRYRPRMGATGALLQGTMGIAVNFLTSATTPAVPGCGSGLTCGGQYTPGDNVPSTTSCATSLHCEVMLFNKWQMTMERLQSITTSNQSFVYGCTGSGSTCPSSCNTPTCGAGPPMQPGELYIIENFKEGEKFPGQWYVDTTTGGGNWTVSYIPQVGENPTTDVIEIGTNAQVFTGSNLQYITFGDPTATPGVNGLFFESDQWTLPTTGYISNQLDKNLSNALVSCASCQHVTFVNNTFRNTTTSALRLTDNANLNTITGNLFYDIGAYGIQYGITPNLTNCTGTCTDSNTPRNSIISENWLEYGSRLFGSADGIMFGLANANIVAGNDIGHWYDKGIEVCIPKCGFQSALDDNNTFGATGSLPGSFGNDVHEIGQGVMTDLAGIYLATEAATGNVVNGNRSHDVNTSIVANPGVPDGSGYTIYLDSNTANVTVTNNTGYRSTASIFHINQGPQAAGTSNTIQNNIGGESAEVGGAFKGILSWQTPQSTAFLLLTYQSNIGFSDVASHTTANGGTGPPATGSSVPQAYVKNVWWYPSSASCASGPCFTIVGHANQNFATWQGTYGEDTAGTASTNPNFTAQAQCPVGVGNWPYPTLGAGGCDDFRFGATGGGSGPGFGFVAYPQSFGPQNRSVVFPVVPPSYPELICQNKPGCQF